MYMSDDEPAFLNATGLDLLEEGRAAFHRFGLTEQSLLQWGKDTLVFPWAGDRIMNTLLVQLRGEGFVVSGEGLAINWCRTQVRGSSQRLSTGAGGSWPCGCSSRRPVASGTITPRAITTVPGRFIAFGRLCVGPTGYVRCLRCHSPIARRGPGYAFSHLAPWLLECLPEAGALEAVSISAAMARCSSPSRVSPVREPAEEGRWECGGRIGRPRS